MADTVNTSASNSVHQTEKAHARLKKRYAFESRFKLLGILAIAFAAAALASLLYTVVGKAIGALTENYIVSEVEYDAELIDPKGERNVKDIRAGDFDTVVRNYLKSEFPSVTGRREKRELYQLTSDAAALEMREAAMADPSIVGKKQDVRLLLGDDADLWKKGYYGRFESLPVAGNATPTGTEGDIKIIVESNALLPVLKLVKRSLSATATGLERDARLQQRGIDFYASRLESAETDAKKEEYKNKISGYTLRRDNFLEKAKALRTRAQAPGGAESLDKDLPSFFIRINGGVMKILRVSTDVAEGRVVLPLNSENPASSENWNLETIEISENGRKISDNQAIWLEKLKRDGKISSVFNWRFFTSGDSREPEKAGIWGSAVGSFWTMLVTFLLSFPIGVLAAIYLEEFAPKNWLTDFIEVNINNLAAVPSIVFGLLGLSVFIGFFGLPRSAPLVGGMVLALMTLPTIIIAARAAIKAVPPSIREAALGVGASKVQSVFHHVLPLAMPGILTGTIIGMAQALGETAPLLMIGMVAFITDIPGGITDSASVLPVQVYQWSDFPENAFKMKTAAAIMVLLSFLVVMNALAVLLRKRFERRW